MANGASALLKRFTDSAGASVSGTGQIGEIITLSPEADEIGLLVVIASGTVAALTIELEHNVGGTWVQVGSVQTTNTSGSSVVFSGVPSLGRYRLNATTVTTPSSLVVVGALVYGKKYD